MTLVLPRRIDIASSRDVPDLARRQTACNDDFLEALRTLQSDNASLLSRIAALESAPAAAPVAPAPGGGGLLWVGEFAQSVSGQNLDATGLDGNAVAAYLVEYYIVNPAGATTYDWWPNSADPGSAAISTSAAAGGSVSDGVLRLTTTGQTRIVGDLMFWAPSGKYRRLHYEQQSFDGAANPSFLSAVEWEALWTDTTTNLTSLRLHASTATGVGAGSYMRVWALVEP